jgi:hypothetical protein
MSTVKIKTTRQLETFLRVLAEESVGMAQASLASNEPARQKDFVKRMAKGKKALTEEEPAGDAPAAPEPAAPPAPEPPADKPAPARTPSDVEPGEINPTLDSVIRAIKEIRSGFGADDSAIEQELSNYFDRLEEAEKISMIVIMRSVGDIMRREATGAEAPEPSQFNVIMSMKSGEKAANEPAAAAPAAPASSGPAPGSAEDTAPPIKVGEPVSESYRRKIKDLLNRHNA